MWSTCEDRERAKELMLVLGLKKTIDLMAMANSAR